MSPSQLSAQLGKNRRRHAGQRPAVGFGVGHLTANGVFSVTQGSTQIGVSQNDPSAGGAGQFLVTTNLTTSFSSAPGSSGGSAVRLLIPMPRRRRAKSAGRF